MARFARRTTFGLLAVLVAGAAFAVLLELVDNDWRAIETGDRALIDAANDFVADRPALVTATKVVTQLGSGRGVTIAIAVTVVFLLIRRLPQLAAYAAVTGLGAGVLTQGIKELVERARPVVDVALSSPSGTSFPSGHALAVTVACGLLLVIFLPAVRRGGARKLAIAAAAGVIVLVGLTRVALGVHYLTDVIGGWLLGATWVAVTASAFRSVRQSQPLRRPIGVLAAELTPAQRHALEPSPGHESPLPDGWTTVARLSVAAVLLWGALVAAGELIQKSLTWLREWDRDAIAWFAGLGGGVLEAISSVIGWLGGVTGTITVLAIAIPIATALSRRWSPALFLFVAAAGQGLIYLLSSRVVGRDRPDLAGAQDMIATVSFPSGHVAASVCVYFGIALLALASTRSPWRFVALPVATVVVLGVAFSRLYKGVHYPSDVVAGMVYGAVWLALCWRWLRPEHHRR